MTKGERRHGHDGHDGAVASLDQARNTARARRWCRSGLTPAMVEGTRRLVGEDHPNCRKARQDLDAQEVFLAENKRRNDELRAAKEGGREAERAVRAEARGWAAEDALKQRMRTSFLAQPGATAEAFEAEWPELLRRYRLERTLAGVPGGQR